MRSAAISRSTSGAGTAVIAAVSGKRIYIHGYVVVAAGTVNLVFEDSDGTDLTGSIPLIANAGVSAPNSVEPWFILPEGKAFHGNIDANVLVAGHVAYSIK